MAEFKQSILSLVIDTSSNLPPDVRKVIGKTMQLEPRGSRSAFALDTIAMNVDMACEQKAPICQDTGMPTFEIKVPVGVDQMTLKKEIEEAIEEATRQGKLRPNSVDSLTGKNSGNNLGPGSPVIHFDQWDKSDEVEVRLLLKGGGCENMNIQYSLPTELQHLGRADRTMDGIRKCVLHAAWHAQGYGCSVGVLGVAVGGDRASGYHYAKQQLFRSLDDANADPELASLESNVMVSANKLGIGTMGFGGNATLIGCKVGVYNRLPASYFVTVAYNCWAFRRQGVVLDAATGKIKRWIYKDDAATSRMAKETGIPLTGREIHLTTPLSENQIRSLRVGDVVLVSGRIHTGRDALHHHLLTHDAPVDLQGSAIYHCGPVALQEKAGPPGSNGRRQAKWFLKAAGPTTSSREEPYQADIIKKFGVRAVIGKGGMGQKTLAALKEYGAVYMSAIGGAAQYYTKCIVDVAGVDFLEFGIPEAMWHIDVKDFPAIVTMDSDGNSLHEEIETHSAKELARLTEFRR